MLRGRTLTAALAALSLLIALLQRPGWASSDTKIDLHVDPGGFLADVASAWSSTGDLGHVQGGQYGGYLFPMGPFFALGHALGGSPWLVQRLWLALVLFLAAWGAARLMEELDGPPLLTSVLVLMNPYVVVFTARTSITLLGYAALPWLLVCVLRGLRAPGWRWPAAFALIVTASGGGVNAAVTAWVLLGPVLLALYARWVGWVSLRAIWALAWRTAVATAFASAWWVMPVLVQSRFGVDFLRFTEQPGTIWSTTSANESLRLMGYWISYLGVGYGGALRPYFGDGGVLVFALPVVIAGLLVPAFALTGFAWTRRQPIAPFALLLVLVGLLVMMAGFPEGTPLRRASNFTYNHFFAVQFLRTTYKAGPLVALGVAMLAGLAAPRWRAAAPVMLVALVACWPLLRGRALDDQLLWKRIPAAWQAAAEHVDRAAGDGRALVLPGQLYAYYDWGGTIDPILPVLTDKPVATRNAVGYADLRATDLLWSTDALVEQRRALPGQLGPLLDLMGARTVVAGADDDRTRSGAVPAADAADVLDQLGPPDAAWGKRVGRRAAGTLGAPRPLPQVRAWDRPDAPGLVRVEPATPQTVVDGSADGLAALAAMGGAPTARGPLDSVAYAADLSPDAIRRAPEVVITDSNRRRVFVPSRMAQNTGPTLPADEAPSVDAAQLNPFPGADAETVAVYDGVERVQAESSPGYSQFPERRPFAALDGDVATAWLADRALTADRHVLTTTFAAPRDVDHVDLLPYSDRGAKLLAVDIGGRRYPLTPGWNRLRTNLRGVSQLAVRTETERTSGPRDAAGIRELRIPGVTVREALRPPVVSERALRGGTAAGLTYLFQRTTGDDPFRRDPRRGTASDALVRDRLDAETGLERVFSPPAARAWTLDGWATVAPDAPDDALDELAGVRGAFRSSGRFEGRPGFRASSAFDGTARPWIGSWVDGRTAWLEWTGPKRTITRLTLDPVPGVRRPTRVALNGHVADVTPDGTVKVPPTTATTFRLEILRAAFAGDTDRQRRAVGIAEIHGARRVQVPRRGALRGRCVLRGTAGGESVALRPAGTIEDLDAARPLRVQGCAPVSLPAGATRLSLPAGTLAPYLLRLRSAGTRAPAPSPGRVLSPGTANRSGGRQGVRLALNAPARLVAAESYNRGRRASCDGHDLGEPTVGDAFGTAWTVPRTCHNVTIAFAPNRLVLAGYAVSALAALVLLVLLLRRRRGNAVARDPAAAGRAAGPGPDAPAAAGRLGGPGSDAPPRGLAARRAAALAIPIALAFGFVFAARGTPLFWLGTFVVLWRGIGARPLALAAGALLGIAVPVLTLLIRPKNRGGYNPEYASDRIVVHWVTVAGIALLILALARELNRARAPRGRGRGAPPKSAARPAPGP